MNENEKATVNAGLALRRQMNAKERQPSIIPLLSAISPYESGPS